MKVLDQVKISDPSPATKLDELKYNDIYICEENGQKYINMFINNREFMVVKMDYDEKFLNELKQSTWTVDATTIRSNSYISYTNKDMRLNTLIKKYGLSPFSIIDEEFIRDNIKMYRNV